ncbi:outer membrane beta-barrel protein, partial [Tenacibaculum maritimum]
LLRIKNYLNMKKIFLSLVLIVLGLTSNAQEKEKAKGGFEKEDWYVTGTAGYSSETKGGLDVSATEFTFSPSAGYFITDNIALELGLTFKSITVPAGLNERITNSFGVVAGGSYFFTPKKDFSFVVGAGVSYSSNSLETNKIKESDVATFGIVVSPGVNYFLSESFALRASIGALSYSNEKMEAPNDSTATGFGFNLNLSDIKLGLTYKF